LHTLQSLVDNKKIKDTVDFDALIKNGLAHKNDLVKILGRGELTAKLDITVEQYSASAKEAIEKCGGKANVLSTVKVAKTTNEESK
jgi:large subunit ribosomal protein L15